jgi:RimJ/RimL family protein N-acetyltransferase
MTTSTTGNPLGPFVEPSPANVPPPHPIKGRHVTLEPRDSSHFDGLYDALGGEHNMGIWDYISNGPYLDRSEFHVAFKRHLEIPNSFVYTIINSDTRKPVGSIALININVENRTIEVGYVLFSSLLQRTVAATEVMYLLASLVFDTLGYRRYEWKCDNLNEPSKRAALRLGFTFEGVFRQHMIIKGRNRDTAWFSMLDTEWPIMAKAFEAWLEERNFDGEGRQRKSLQALRDAAAKVS